MHHTPVTDAAIDLNPFSSVLTHLFFFYPHAMELLDTFHRYVIYSEEMNFH